MSILESLFLLQFYKIFSIRAIELFTSTQIKIKEEKGYSISLNIADKETDAFHEALHTLIMVQPNKIIERRESSKNSIVTCFQHLFEYDRLRPFK